ncbi:M56 family metallopeptidase [Sciscionella marina]|uniref:M56 family metallopeptidase n=1 Tax=Sciscionella marina TaxID=508770 RepID=UPI0012F6675D|nr:M56 family metallopeptidase [Sciscionella marina]
MTPWGVGGLALGAAAAAVLLVLRSDWARRHASPRLRAMTYLIGLVGLALLPVAGLICSGAALANAVTGSPVGCGWSVHLLASAPLTAGLAVAILGVIVPVVLQGKRVVAAADRTELGPMVRARATRRYVAGGGSVWVLPAEPVAAHTSGWRHPEAVVTSGLLALLGPTEQEAVCEHEAAHVRLGHPRLLLIAAAITRAYGFLPLVRRAWCGLRRELEAAADDEAARQVGTAPVLSALARIGLAHVGGTHGTTAEFADRDHLSYRLARLQHPQSSTCRADTSVALVALTLATGLAWSACTLAVGNPAFTGVALCLTVLVGIGLRPVWPWNHRGAGPRRAPGPNVVG